MNQPVQEWRAALSEYSYRVDLSEFSGRQNHARSFDRTISGDRQSTCEFEDHFRGNARYRLEAWFEVVYWKMFSQRGRADIRTNACIQLVREKGLSPSQLFEIALEYAHRPSQTGLKLIARHIVGERTRHIAIASTFPAFLKPDSIPMVDSRVSKWVSSYGEVHNLAGISPRLKIPDDPKAPLTLSDWPFIDSWIRWSQHMAGKLTALTGENWRARDVEMAVFTKYRKLLPPL